MDGVYCELENSLLSIREVRNIEDHLRNWVLADHAIPYESGKDLLYHCHIDNHEITTLYPPLDRAGSLKYFKLIHFPPGFILLFPNANHPETISHLFLPKNSLQLFPKPNVG